MKAVNVEKIQCVADSGAVLGEGPLWDPREKALYWLDIKGDKIYRFDPQTSETITYPSTGMVSALGLHKEGGFIAAKRNGFIRLRIDGCNVQASSIVDPEADKPDNRFNDGKVDPAGGFWAGTMDNTEQEVSGCWWRLAPDGGVSNLAKGFKVTNGPAFDDECGRVFITDSARRIVFTAKTDGATLGSLEPFLSFKQGDGFPDGMEIDAEGGLWIAFWDGGCVRRFAPNGQFVQEIALPVPRPTSVAIVENALYVTSASVGLNDQVRAGAPLSGGLFRILLDRKVGVVGTAYG